MFCVLLFVSAVVVFLLCCLPRLRLFRYRPCTRYFSCTFVSNQRVVFKRNTPVQLLIVRHINSSFFQMVLKFSDSFQPELFPKILPNRTFFVFRHSLRIHIRSRMRLKHRGKSKLKDSRNGGFYHIIHGLDFQVGKYMIKTYPTVQWYSSHMFSIS